MITTWAQTQTILDLDAGLQTRVDALIPLVEDDYLHIRNKPFDVGNILTITAPCTADGDLTVTYNDANFTVPVLNGDNTLVVARKIAFAIDRVTQGVVTVSGSAVTFLGYATLTFAAGGTGVTVTTSGIDTIYPTGAELTAIRMIEHHLTGGSRAAAQNASSESLGDYSISYKAGGPGTTISDYPQSIVGGIKRYVSFV